MFGWFVKTFPVDAPFHAWIERRWQWLTEQFGSNVARTAPTVLPTREFFPDVYDGSEAAGRTMLNRVCGYMNVAPNLIDLQYYANTRQFNIVNDAGRDVGVAGGTYHRGDSRFVIRLDRAKLDQPMRLVATMAHELAHVRLLGERRITSDAWDNELLTDLAAIFHGFGTFRANHPAYWHEHSGVWPDTDIPRPEYMTTPMLAFALAYRSWIRNEVPVAWTKHLKAGVRSEFKHAVRSLRGSEHHHR